MAASLATSLIEIENLTSLVNLHRSSLPVYNQVMQALFAPCYIIYKYYVYFVVLCANSLQEQEVQYFK